MTVYRSYFDEEEDMATAKELLQSINHRTATIRPAVKEDEVQRILGVYGVTEESSQLTPEKEMDTFLEMYSSNKDISSQHVISVSDSCNPDDQGYFSQRIMDDDDDAPLQNLTQKTTSSLPNKTVVTVGTQTPPMDIVSTMISHSIADITDEDFKSKDSAVFPPSTSNSSSPRYHYTTSNIIEHQHYRQQRQQQHQSQQPPQPSMHQQHPIFIETESRSPACIGIQDIIDVKNEIASTKHELSKATANINYRRTPTIIRLETKIERLETLLIEYIRMERMEFSMMEHLQNKHIGENDEIQNDRIQNLEVTESVIPTTTIGKSSSSPLLSHQNHYYHSVEPYSIGPSSIISSEKTPSKSMWLTDQRPSSIQHNGSGQQNDEKTVCLEDLWDLLALAEQLNGQN